MKVPNLNFRRCLAHCPTHCSRFSISLSSDWKCFDLPTYSLLSHVMLGRSGHTGSCDFPPPCYSNLGGGPDLGERVGISAIWHFRLPILHQKRSTMNVVFFTNLKWISYYIERETFSSRIRMVHIFDCKSAS